MTKTVEFNSLSKLKEFYSTCRELCMGWIIQQKSNKNPTKGLKNIKHQQLYQMYNNCTTNLQMYNFCTYCTNLVHSQYYLNTYYSTYFNVYYIMYCITYIITLTKRAQPKCKSLSAMCTNQWSSSYTLNRVGPLFSVHTNTLIKIT